MLYNTIQGDIQCLQYKRQVLPMSTHEAWGLGGSAVSNWAVSEDLFTPVQSLDLSYLKSHRGENSNVLSDWVLKVKVKQIGQFTHLSL